MNLEMMKQLLDRGIEPTLLNEVLRRELAEAAPKAPQVVVQMAPVHSVAKVESEPESSAPIVDMMMRTRDSTSERRLFKSWTQMDPALREMVGKLRAAQGLVGGQTELASRLGITYGTARGLLEGYNVPSNLEARIVASIIGESESAVIATCKRASDALDRLREAHAIRRAKRRKTTEQA